jgi:hypothetical protein
MTPRFRSASVALLLPFASIAWLSAQSAANTLTWHNDISRTGLNPAETVLTPANVSPTTFGKVGFFATDGVVDAQPLYVAKLTIGGAAHNVVFIATEHGSVYADDAATGATLWKTSLLNSGETTSGSQGCSQISPEIGITATPVIDLSKGPHGALYVVNMAHDAGGNYHQRLNALDLTTGAQLFGGPTVITASYPGTGDSSSGGNVVFEPGQYAERAGLLEWNGTILTAWTSHCDKRPYTGWIIGYDATTLQQTSVLNLTPNGSEGAIWMSGAGLAATPTKVLFLDANGTFDTTLDENKFPINQDFGNAFVELGLDGNSKLQVQDYYATDTTVQQSAADTDLGSGGTIILPDIYDNNGHFHHLAVGAGKDTNIYLVDRTNLGKYHPEGGSIYQLLPAALPHGEWAAPAYFDNKVYYGGVNDYLKAFTFSNAKLVAAPASSSPNIYGYPGTTPSISANGTANGIVWAVYHSSPAVLFAYNAEDLSQELYSSNKSGTRDQFGSVDHFIDPMIANGRVYVPTTTGVAVFGLLAK